MQNINLRSFFIVLFSCSLNFISAQQVQFNEAVSSNSQILDEDNDSPDWFELLNTSSTDVVLSGWTISDKIDQPEKWMFPDLILEPDEYLFLWASGKDRSIIGMPRTLITEGDLFKYTISTGTTSPQWKELGFDDSAWQEGATGFGYGDGDDATLVQPGTRSVFLRKRFVVADISVLEELIFDIDYDDAFVAYINGAELVRANIEGNPPAFNATALTDHEAKIYEGGFPDRFVFDNPSDFLQNGENVLSIQIHNVNNTSSDMSVIPFLSAIYNSPTNEGFDPPTILQLTNTWLHTNFKIASEEETLYLFDENTNLVDSLLIKNLQPDISIGIPLGGSDLVYFETPTPGQPNDGNGFIGINTEEIIFSHPGGNVDVLSLELSGISSPSVIRYTLDGTIPNGNSTPYTSSISINSNTVVRTRVFQPNYIPSKTQSKTYLINVSHDLPIISLVTEPDGFFDNDEGIYVLGDNADNNFPHFGANFWEDWERPVHFTFYETNNSIGLTFDGGTKIFGGWSRGSAQKSLSIFARNQYGFGEIDYPLFPNNNYSNYQAFVLRNSGNDWLNTMMRDGTLTGLMKGSGLDYQAYRPVVTYINGEYWGFYNIREKINEHSLASKHKVNSDGIDILEFDGQLIYGDNQDYLDLMNFISNNNLSFDNNYNQVSEEVNLENFIIYNVAQIYFNNTDWPGNNIKYWRPENGKWKWVLFDTDFGFGIWNNFDYSNNTMDFVLEPNGPEWPNPPWSTLLFRKLMQNISFTNDFVNRMADELNSRFLPDRVCEHIDTVSAKIESEIAPHYNRWGGDTPYWNEKVNAMKNFANQRPFWMKNHILNELNLPDFHELTIDNNNLDKGFVKINNRLLIKENNWSGDYFENVPVKVKAIPKPGFVFSHWSGGSSSTNTEIQINLNGAITMVPNFESSSEILPIVINEINYNSDEDFDSDDWIELYNPNPFYIDLSNYIFKDDDDAHIFEIEEGTILEGEGFLIIAKGVTKFKSIYPDVENIIGDFDFGLSSDGDAVRIYNTLSELQDVVNYEPVNPWPEAANGEGYTLELIDPTLDNNLPENWLNIHSYGSPGEANTDVVNNVHDIEINELKYYPNPFSDQISISFSAPKNIRLKATLYNMSGAAVYSIFNKEFAQGKHEVTEDIGHLRNGVYVFELMDENKKKVAIKWVKL